MHPPDRSARFENTILPHLDAAYNLARWLTRSSHDAEDVVQEACLRAYQFYSGYRGGDSRAWLLRIVRNTCYSWLQNNRPAEQPIPLSDNYEVPSLEKSPEALVISDMEVGRIREAIDKLPTEFREVLVLRDLEDLSYKEIADIADIPLGTVMSRLARARRRVALCLADHKENDHDL